MNGKIVFCFAVVFVGQAMSAATTTGFEVEDFKKIFDQVSASSVSVVNHMAGLYSNSGDVQKTFDKTKAAITKALTELEDGTAKMKDTMRKNIDPKISEKMDELEKEFRKQITEAKTIFDDKIGKPLSEKIEFKKMTDTFIKSAKDFEAGANKAIDQMKSTKA